MAVTIPDQDHAVPFLCRRIQALLERQKQHPDRRMLVVLAGVPGSGKSTIAAAVLQALPAYGIDRVQVVPMDGFHYPKAVLKTFKDPVQAFRRRGAPFTFDVDAFLKLLVKLRAAPVTAAADPETVVARAPSFDHAVQDSVPDDIAISSRVKLVIVEGNYTLLDQEPWNRVARLADDRWFVDVAPAVVKERLIQRHIQAGVETTRAGAEHRVEENDMPNGEFIRAHLIEPLVRIPN